MHNDVKKLQVMADALHEAHAAFYEMIVPITKKIEEGVEYNDVAMADLGFLCRELEDLLDEWRKDSKVRKELVGRLLCSMLVHSDRELVRADLCRAQAKIGMRPQFPKKGTDDYYALLAYYGITDPDNQPVSLSWVGVAKVCTKLIEQGKPLPPGMKEPMSDPTCIFTRRTSNADTD